ncbi:MAG TPA: type I polyketide synthase [Spirillospora sp.]|nr:type I polyketide synthase [Spirillospora sp.]
MSSDFLKRVSQLSPQRLALLAAELQAKLENAERQKSAPIAVIGMSCRFPGGADDPESYWEMLRSGVDAVTEVPASRWDIEAYYDPDPDAPGKMNTRWGGFLDQVDQFDPQFFGISPREAMSMDPQQRFLLEVAWEALERAGYAPDGLAGSLTGVFVGMCNNDYGNMMLGNSDQIDLYLATGGASSVASGRLSYVLGLQGPSISIDTACSSSLVAVHLAVQALRAGDCRMALAGGVNMILMPETTVTLSKAKMMAPDGRCKAFDSRADGFVRGEGCGIVVLKKLADAVADGDHVLAVIRGSAVNQDGRSNGLTAPNGPSQTAVIRAALADARLEPKDISYIETHGTGTSLGDPIEVQALGAALGAGHSHESPLMIGSVKTNIGHLESAAGIAGLIKLILMVQHGEIPPHLHFIEPNPYIPWDDLPVAVPDGLRPWSPENGKRIGGVSSFGFSGTNAHIIVEQAPKSRRPAQENERPLHILTLSGRDETALRQVVERFERHLADHSDPIGDVCFTANSGRSHQTHRLAVVAADIDTFRDSLAAYRAGQQPDNLLVGQAQREKRIAFLFTGQGAQYVAMGQQLYETEATFRAVIDQCDELLRPLLGRSLLSILYPQPGEESPIHDIAYAQPAQFAVEYALAKLWESWGIRPSVVLGHSIGEYAAACMAGVFSLEDGLKLVTARSRLMSQTAPGEMASVFTDPAHVARVIAPYKDRVAIAAVNGPEMVVISGEKEAIAAVIEDLRVDKVRARRLEVSIAGHSPLMEPILDAFARVASEVTYSAPQVEFISGLTGDFIEGHEVTNAAYWRRHLRETVQFSTAIQTLDASGYSIFLEIGPAPTLISLGQRILTTAGLWLPSLREGHGDWQTMLKSLAALYTWGVDVDWPGFDRDYQRSRVVLPTYPFQNASYWVEQSRTRRAQPRGGTPGIHPLLGQRLRSPAIKDVVFESQLSATWPPFLDHHRIYGVVILPSPAYLEMALRAAASHFGPGSYAVENFAIRTALILPEDDLRTVQFVMSPDPSGAADFEVVSLDGDDWTLHATGSLRAAAQPSAAPFDRAEVQARCSEMIDGVDYYERVRDLGLEFGSNFRGIREIWRRDGEALGRVELPDELIAQAGQYAIHPAFLDACFHLLGAPLPADDPLEMAYLLIGMDSFQLYRTPGRELWNHTILTESINSETFTGDCYLYDEDGTLVAEVRGLHLKRAGREALMWATRQRPDELFYKVEWIDQPKAHQANLLPPPAEIAATVAAATAQTVAEFPAQTFADLSAALDQESLHYVIAALRELGWTMTSGDHITIDELASRLGIIPRYRPLLQHLLTVLVAEGFLVASPEGDFEVVQTPDSVDSGGSADALAAQFADYAPMLDLLGRCGPALAGVLRGEIDPLHLLFPNGSLAETEALYQEIPTAVLYNGIVRQTVAAITAGSVGRLRVLEIGAGTGGTTAALLPELPAERTDYVFTDVSPLFLERAREKFSRYPFVRYELLDIEQEPDAQGFAGQQFDVIVAANVLHATENLTQTLAHVRHLLAPGGRLILMEGTRPQRWVDLTFGLTEGWWRFHDFSLRPSYPLLTRSAWKNLLQEQGFDQVVMLPEVAGDSPLEGQAIIIAGGLTAEPSSVEAGNWLIFADADGVGEALAADLAARGAACLLVRPGEQFSVVDDNHWRIAPYDAGQYQQLLDAVDDWAGVVDLWSLDSEVFTTGAADIDATALTRHTLLLTQALIQKGASVPLWLVTESGQPVETETIDVTGSPLWGFGRVVALEHPEIWGGLIDLENAVPPAERARLLAAEILLPDGEDQIAVRGGRRYVARLVRSTAPAAASPQFRDDGAYLITGGLGGLGLKLAQWMSEHGAGHLILTSRRGLPDRAEWPELADHPDFAAKIAAVEAMEARGTQVTVAAVDVGDADGMAQVFRQFGSALRGVFHLAAALEFWPLEVMPLDGLAAMLRSKVTGAWNLHQLSQGLELDHFVLFSSTTALWGVSRMAHYAAANTFLDALAHYRHSLGQPALSINWGTWEEMRIASAEDQQAVAQFGLNQIPTAQALDILGDLLAGSAEAQVVVASVDWALLKPAYEVRRERPFLSGMTVLPSQISRRTDTEQAKAAAGPKISDRLADMEADERREALIEYVAGEVGLILGMSASDVDIHRGLFEMGMDSLMSVDLKSHLEQGTGLSLPSTLTFNYPTVAELAEYLDSRLAPAPAASPQPAETRPEPAADLPVADIDELSEEDLEALLLKKLKGWQ